MSRKTADARLAALRAMSYDKYLLTPEWRERRKGAIGWARNACQLCNSTEKPLHVHHRTYDRLGAELPADLVVLCAKCHTTFHGKEKSANAKEVAVASIEELLDLNIREPLGDILTELNRLSSHFGPTEQRGLDCPMEFSACVSTLMDYRKMAAGTPAETEIEDAWATVCREWLLLGTLGFDWQDDVVEWLIKYGLITPDTRDFLLAPEEKQHVSND